MSNAHMIGAIGPPGTGKSSLIRSALEWAAANGKRGAVACMPPSEADSYPPSAHIIKPFQDPGWEPMDGNFAANGWMELYKWLGAMLKVPDIAVVGIDTGNEAGELGMHDFLKDHNTGDPSSLDYGRAYIGHDRRLKYLLSRSEKLAAAGKHIIWTWHGQMREMEGQGKAELKVTMKNPKKALTYPDQFLPALPTAYRQHVSKWFSLWLSSYYEGVGMGAKYFVSAVPQAGVPAKSRIALVPPMGSTLERMPNDFGIILKAIEAGRPHETPTPTPS